MRINFKEMYSIMCAYKEGVPLISIEGTDPYMQMHRHMAPLPAYTDMNEIALDRDGALSV